MNEQTGIMDESIKELVAIGASVGAHCQPCLEYHIQAAFELGIAEEDIRAAIAVGHAVEKGAQSAMKKFSTQVVDDFFSAAGKADNQLAGVAKEKKATETVLKIYDPALCCSSGVCGPSVDPVLAQFAGTLKYLEAHPNIRVERYNLGQQPQAFVENAGVKSMLGNGGEKELPFIFIDEQVWLKGRYPLKTELLDALNIKSDPEVAPFWGHIANAPCCGEEGCC
jgi:AhpD family alkylhydroperoxidase